ncbi:A/G-specific adenine glycosylase [Lawsonibacter sp. OA9]|uniref:A/G-specific adenine glycosylase n=1 Tax=Oscillospiraceae TaxID=216572 RepID=UPI001F056C5D|nr:A/G-specific adenine glycosylase [Lawsonibacter sp. OA9]MCH1978218.1 A/G-specific adenine glycosylase [Lawsonibacter sp. OA9]MCH1982648.1 A/G-specific adenine glycosylase [Ruminococcus sp. OA3]
MKEYDNAEKLKGIVEPLIEWYLENKRVLPWREQKNPYYIWISEIMLQQTRVEAVKPYFQRFISALPTVEDVACCDEAKLLKLWEGLGYYNRVRNIQKAAQRVVELYDGKLPADYDELLGLPGIGDYTAGAVASIAYNIPVPAVDGNVLRVVSRLTENVEDILKQKVKNQIRSELLKIMPVDVPGEFNQALMELGATVCVPNGMAKCEACPIAKLCGARLHNRQGEIPVRKKAKERRLEEKTVLIIQDGDKVAIRKRPSKGLLAGLYELVNFDGHLSEEEVLERMKGYQLTTLRILPVEQSKHIFSHVEWRMIGYIVKVAALEGDENNDMLFVDIRHAEEKYPVPAAFGAYAAYMNMRLGQGKYTGGKL